MGGPSTVLRGVMMATVALVALTGCGGGTDSSDPGDKPGISISFAPDNLAIRQGETGTMQVSITRSPGFKGTLSLAVPNLPSEITASFNPASLPEGNSSSTLTIVVGANAPLGTVPVYVEPTIGGERANIDGGSTSFPLTVILRPTVTVTKAGSGSGTVTSSPAGINCGNACSALFVREPVTLTAVPATGSAFASWAGSCVGTSLTCTFTPGQFVSAVTATFNTAPAMAVSVSPSPVTVQAGGNSTTATVTITRINGFADPVALAVNAPVGLTVTANPTSITGTTSTLTIGAAAVGAGNYPVTITATGTGVTQQVATLAVQVTPAAGGGAITFNYAGCETTQIPLWFAVQNGTGPWTRITPTNNAFTFAIGATGAIAIVTRNAPDTETQVTYGSAQEIAAIAIAGPCRSPATGTKTVSGTFANAGTVGLDTTQVIIGGAQFTRPDANTLGFTLTNVPNGPRDLIAARSRGSDRTFSKMVLRRGTNYANNAVIPLVDFANNTVDAFIPRMGGITIPNLGADSVALDASLITTNGASLSYFSIFVGGTLRAGYLGLPDSLLRDGDFHALSVAAASSSANGTSYRFMQLIQRLANEKSVPFGPAMGSRPVITTIGTSPSLRLRAQISTQSTYTSGASAEFEQNGIVVGIGMTAAYLAATPSTWTLEIPDFSAAGYDAAWGLKSGTAFAWSAAAASGNVLPFLGGPPVDNAMITGVAADGSSSSALMAKHQMLLAPWRRR